MKLKSNVIIISAALAVFMFASCKKTDVKPGPSQSTYLENKVSENGTNPDEAIFRQNNGEEETNYFYVESNDKRANTVLVFSQNKSGQIILTDEVKSGGYGYGQALGSQGAVAVSKEYNLLFAVNAGSGTISSFRINEYTGGLKLLFTEYSKGLLPNSITVHGNKLYVLNNLSSSVSGFSFTQNGFLSPIEGSTHNLSAANVDAPQIKFQPDGAAVYVTEKATNIIDKFILDSKGAITEAYTIQSKGVEPFGFDYGRNLNYLIVSNAANAFSGAGSCTSYEFANTGLNDVNGPVGNFETAPCWVATTRYGAFAFVSNTGSNNLSSYYIDKEGVLTLLKPVAAADGRKPIDIAVSQDNRYVYNIYSGSHSLAAYKRTQGGVITLVDKVSSLPEFAAGLATY